MKAIDKACDGPMDYDPACWEKIYDYLDSDNEMEWWIAMEATWYNLGWLAILGPCFITTSLFSILGVLFMPEMLPNAEMDIDELSEWDLMHLEWVGWTASMGAPTLFMITQMLTMGESNFSDISILYMEPMDASLYFMFNSWWVMQHYPYALLHMALFWWIYACQFGMWAHKHMEEMMEEDSKNRWSDMDDMDKKDMDDMDKDEHEEDDE